MHRTAAHKPPFDENLGRAPERARAPLSLSLSHPPPSARAPAHLPPHTDTHTGARPPPRAMPTARRPSLLTTLFTRAPRGPVTDWDGGDVARWAGTSVIAEEFRKGVASGALNVVFDCGVVGLPYKVRIHMKVSPILGTYWAFIKRLQRAAA